MRRLLTPALVLALSACTSGREAAPPPDDSSSRTELLARLDGYTAAARAVDAEASSAFFTAQGTLFEPGIPPIISRDSIRAFIRSFPGVIVDSAMARADTIQVYGRTAFIWGSFFEKLRFQGQPPSSQHGRFVMEWRREADDAWRIHRYYRVPLPPNWKP
jgi:ketosteroid isomerase-like protein